MRLNRAGHLLTAALLLTLAAPAQANGHDYPPTDLQCTGGPVFGLEPCGISTYVEDLDGQEFGAHIHYTETEPQCIDSSCTPPLPWCFDVGFVVYDIWYDFDLVCAILGPLAP